MAFRYINPGYASLIVDTKIEQVESLVYNPTNGVAFTGKDTENDVETDTFHMDSAPDKLFGRFDLYLDGGEDEEDYGALKFGIKNASSGSALRLGFKIHSFYDADLTNVYTITDPIVYDSEPCLEVNKVNEITFSIRFNLEDTYRETGTAELTINGNKKIWKFHGYNYSDQIKSFAIFFCGTNSNAGRHYVSNLILSDAEISENEKVAVLPISSTETNMTEGTSGLYIADASNQTLLQSVDVEELIKSYGANIKITGIELVGNPAYKTTEDINSLVVLSKAGESIAEHGTFNLSGDSTAIIMDGWTDNISVNNLRNMRFGWKAGE